VLNVSRLCGSLGVIGGGKCFHFGLQTVCFPYLPGWLSEAHCLQGQLNVDWGIFGVAIALCASWQQSRWLLTFSHVWGILRSTDNTRNQREAGSENNLRICYHVESLGFRLACFESQRHTWASKGIALRKWMETMNERHSFKKIHYYPTLALIFNSKVLDFNCTPHIDQVTTQLGLVPRQCSLTFRIL
jgi:hypothetical protein